MGLESTTYIDGLVVTNPLPTDQKSAGDDHIRLLKSSIKATFPNISAAVTPTHTELNYVDGVTSAIQTQLDAITTLADGKVYVGNGSNVATEVTPSGDVTMTNAGVTAIGATKVTKTMLNSNVFASNAEATTGTATDIALPPSVFASSGRQSIATSGYQKLPGGLIIQWGVSSRVLNTASTNTVVVTFPIAFPTACLVALPTFQRDNAVSFSLDGTTFDTTTCTSTWTSYDGSARQQDGYVKYVAIGY